MTQSRAQVTVATAPNPGAIAIIQLTGPASRDLLQEVTQTSDFPAGRMKLVSFDDIDQGMAVYLPGPTAERDWVQLLPHGGVRVVQRLIDRLIGLGATYDARPDPQALYPEASDELEADMLAAMARAASPAAIDLLAVQPDLWRSALRDDILRDTATRQQILERSRIFDRLLTPSTVVVVGRPNVGKSTLTNHLMGRGASIVADLPGTTRDWVAGMVEIASDHDAPPVAVRWLDTPGLRVSEDPIEQRAIDLSRQVIAGADVIIAMRDPQHDWPDAAALPRSPHVWLMNKMEDADDDAAQDGRSAQQPLPISAMTGHHLNLLQQRICQCLTLTDLSPKLWAFCPALRERCMTGA